MSELILDRDPSVSEAVREANRHIAAKAARLRFLARVPFICECSDPDCRRFVPLTVAEYERALREGRRLLVPGHAVAATTTA